MTINQRLDNSRPGSRLGLRSLAPQTDSPLLDRLDHDAPSVFRPENMLREARRQKGLTPGDVPSFCILDPDGDIVQFVRRERGARRSEHWACYHTQLWEWTEGGLRYGIVGSAVGGAFAVLVAEQLFASGCDLLISIASAGRLGEVHTAEDRIVIERALRDEGTSHHYLKPEPYAEAEAELVAFAWSAASQAGCKVRKGATWTTDAPFRETASTIAQRKAQGLIVVEMEAASLYAFATACARPVLCIAHVTNELGCINGDFEKGELQGACISLDLVYAIATAWAAERVISEPKIACVV